MKKQKKKETTLHIDNAEKNDVDGRNKEPEPCDLVLCVNSMFVC